MLVPQKEILQPNVEMKIPIKNSDTLQSANISSPFLGRWHSPRPAEVGLGCAGYFGQQTVTGMTSAISRRSSQSQAISNSVNLAVFQLVACPPAQALA
jgi:hypothetical protein